MYEFVALMLQLHERMSFIKLQSSKHPSSLPGMHNTRLYRLDSLLQSFAQGKHCDEKICLWPKNTRIRAPKDT